MSIFFGHTMTMSSAYYRMINYAKKMRRMGTKTYWNDWDPIKMNNQANNYFVSGLSDPKSQNDIVKELTFLHDKRGVNTWVMQLLCNVWGLALMDYIQKHWNQPLITEVDDYFLNVHSASMGTDFYAPGTEGRSLAISQVEESSMVIVSTEYLKEKLLTYNKNIQVIPNSVDFSLWKVLPPQQTGKVIIGWEGSHGHEPDLAILEDVIPAILDKYPNVEFQFIGQPDIPKSLSNNPRIKLLPVWLPVTQYPAYKARLGWDIELAPLVDTEFNRCKSNLRWLEASALKIPLLSSNVIPYKNTSALLLSDTSDWIAAMSDLIEHPVYREMLGKQAYKEVRENYSAPKIARQYLNILNAEQTRVEKVVNELKLGGKI